jgi:hypothetical protein
VTGVENVGYLYGKRFGSKNSLSHSEGGSRYSNRLWRATTHLEAKGTCVREIRLCFGMRRVSHGMVEFKILFFRWLV